jgi:SsrA-binding protein
MAKGDKNDSKADADGLIHVCRNRRATHDYVIMDAVECGVVLCGTEVKSLRDGHASLDEAYARIDDGEVWLIGCEIPEYWAGNRMNHTPKRPRKLLLRRREIAKFAGKASDRGFTLVPLRIYFKAGRAKVEIAIGKGKQTHDKRHALKDAESRREMDRELVRKRRT